MSTPFRISGRVVRGRGLGHRLGFPTANLALTDRRIADGVYAAWATVDGTTRPGVANAGTRPTVTDAPERFLEIYLFDFQGDLYGKPIQAELVARLRDEQKFDSIDALRRQIEQDKINAQKILAHERL